MFRSFNSIKGELIPYLIKKQYRRKVKRVEEQEMSKETVAEDSKNGKYTLSFYR
jgi:hypothetical protein